jgi:large subunit ribosomal protein L4
MSAPDDMTLGEGVAPVAAKRGRARKADAAPSAAAAGTAEVAARPAKARTTAAAGPAAETWAEGQPLRLAVRTLEGGEAGEIELPATLFGLPARADILHRVVTWQLANRRAYARAAKERSDVNRTGKKFGRQKGSGAARHGNRAAPQFVGGGKAHGPRARSFEQSLNKKIRALGLKTALSVKAAEGKVIVVDEFRLSEARTKAMIEALGRLGIERGLFIDGAAVDRNFALAARNLHKVDVLPAIGANVYDILNHDALVLSRAGVEQLMQRLEGRTNG